MKLRSVYFISGHKLLDDGAGGYKLDCPQSGDMGPGDPGMVVILTSRPESVCFGCGQPVGRLSFGSPKPYETEEPAMPELQKLAEEAQPTWTGIDMASEPDQTGDICPGATCEKGDELP